MKCKITQCNNEVRSLGMCNTHYQRNRRNGDPNKTLRERHGMFGTPEYNSWASMKDRCGNPNHDYYENYGGRGVTVCAEWSESFSSFYKDMGPRPAGSTLDRIDNGKGYAPGNCKWATRKEQAANRRTRRVNKGNSIGVSGVFKHDDKYRSTLYGKYIGEYKTMDEAISARLSAESGVDF